jgi:hypothetical protein
MRTSALLTTLFALTMPFFVHADTTWDDANCRTHSNLYPGLMSWTNAKDGLEGCKILQRLMVLQPVTFDAAETLADDHGVVEYFEKGKSDGVRCSYSLKVGIKISPEMSNYINGNWVEDTDSLDKELEKIVTIDCSMS